MSLSSKYFETTFGKSIGNYSYYIVRPKGNPMVLFSNIDGTPLASVQVRCQEGQIGNSLITRRLNGETNFQALINQDHQEFEFVITNLTGEGMIKIDIMKNEDKVVDVDPGTAKGGVNQVNELHEYQSYAIQCDQKDNLSFILDSIKKSDGSNITVKEAEDEKKTQLAKYWISVVAEAGKPELVQKFTETFWACPDVFVIKKYEPPLIPKSFSRARSYSDDEEGFEISVCSFGAESYSHNESAQLSMCSLSMPRCMPQSAMSKGPVQQSAMMSFCEPVQKDEGHMDSIVNQSSAASVRGGRQMQVSSGFTGKGYAYDNHSVKCTLGISVAEGLMFRNPPTQEELREIGNVIIQHYIEDSLKIYLNLLTQVYLSEECVICMDGSPSSVFYSCGHQCCHHDCAEKLTQCPLCRLHITANIKV